MKTVKRVIVILTLIILAFVIGYLIYTGSRVTDVTNEATIGGLYGLI